MTAIFITYYDKRTEHFITARMGENGGLFMFRLCGITLLYDNRTKESKFKWGYQRTESARHIFDYFVSMKKKVNNLAEWQKLGFKLESFMIREWN